MATYYIDPAATGSGNGSSWANAYTTIAAALPAITEASGDWFKISYLTNETLAANLASQVQGSGTNRGCRFTSADPGTDGYRAGAKIVTAGFTVDLFGLNEGITFDGSTAAANLNVRPGNGSEFAFCAFVKQAGFSFQIAGANHQRGTLRNCTLSQGTGYTAPLFVTNTAFCDLEVLNCTLSGSIGASAALIGQTVAAAAARFRIVGTDVSGFTSLIDHVGGNGNGYVDLRLEDCLRPSSYEVETGQGELLLRKGATVTMLNTGNGTLLAPNIERAYWNHYGKAAIQSTVYRVGGGHNGTSRQAWAVTNYANRTWTRSRHGITVPVTGPWVYKDAPVTVRVYLAHSGTALTSDEVGFRIRTPSTAVSPDALGYTVSSVPALDVSATTYATDSTSSWGGSPSVKQYIEHTFTPTVSGPVTGEVMFHSGSSSDRTIYVDAGIFAV